MLFQTKFSLLGSSTTIPWIEYDKRTIKYQTLINFYFHSDKNISPPMLEMQEF